MAKKRVEFKRAPLLPSFTPVHYHELRQFMAEMGSMFTRGSEQARRSYQIDPEDRYIEHKRYYDHAAKAVKFILDQLRLDENRHKSQDGGKQCATG